MEFSLTNLLAMVLRIMNLIGLNHIYVIGLKLFMLIPSYQILKPTCIILEFLKAQF